MYVRNQIPCACDLMTITLPCMHGPCSTHTHTHMCIACHLHTCCLHDNMHTCRCVHKLCISDIIMPNNNGLLWLHVYIKLWPSQMKKHLCLTNLSYLPSYHSIKDILVHAHVHVHVCQLKFMAYTTDNTCMYMYNTELNENGLTHADEDYCCFKFSNTISMITSLEQWSFTYRFMHIALAETLRQQNAVYKHTCRHRRIITSLTLYMHMNKCTHIYRMV